MERHMKTGILWHNILNARLTFKLSHTVWNAALHLHRIPELGSSSDVIFQHLTGDCSASANLASTLLQY